MPEYGPGLPVVLPILLAALLRAPLSGVGNMLNVLNKQLLYLRVQIIALILMVTLDFFFVKAGWGFIGIAWATAVSFVLYGGVLAFVGYRTILELKLNKG